MGGQLPKMNEWAHTKNYTTTYLGQRATATLVHDNDLVLPFRMLPIRVMGE